MIKRRLSNLLFDLRHPWWTFTREIALLHCQRTNQMLVRSPVYNFDNASGADEAFSAAIRLAERKLTEDE